MILQRDKILDYGEIPSHLRAHTLELLIEALSRTKPSTRPRFIHLCGIPGSGKTTYAEQFRFCEPSFALVQFDTVMESLEGYRADKASQGLAIAFKRWELPARAIGYHLLQALLENGHDVVFDHSAYCSDHLTLIDTAKAWGYSVEMHYLSCPVQLCMQRVSEREARIGRHTPPHLISERERLLKVLLPLYKARVDKFLAIEQTQFAPVALQAPAVIPA